MVEMRTPGKFFIHIQSVEMSETLKTIALNLQKIYCGSLASVYKPEIGEVCAVKFSFDQVNDIVFLIVQIIRMRL